MIRYKLDRNNDQLPDHNRIVNKRSFDKYFMGKRKEVFIKSAFITRDGGYQAIYNASKAQGMSNKKAKNFARLVIMERMSLSSLEQEIMEENPKYRGKISEDLQEVESYIDFEVIDEIPTKQHLGFCNINMKAAKKSFIKVGKLAQYRALKQYINDNPKYLPNVFHPMYEAICNAADEKYPEAQTVEDQEPPKNRPMMSPKSPRKHG